MGHVSRVHFANTFTGPTLHNNRIATIFLCAMETWFGTSFVGHCSFHLKDGCDSRCTIAVWPGWPSSRVAGSQSTPWAILATCRALKWPPLDRVWFAVSFVDFTSSKHLHTPHGHTLTTNQSNSFRSFNCWFIHLSVLHFYHNYCFSLLFVPLPFASEWV